MRRKVILVAATFAVVAIFVPVAAVAIEAISGTEGVIYGCYNKRDGALRVIDPAAKSCTDRETTIYWDQQGPQGDRGDPGDRGWPGFSGYEVVRSDAVTTLADDPVSTFAGCPAGKRVFGGGFHQTIGTTPLWVFGYPEQTENKWTAVIYSTSYDAEVYVFAICATVSE